MFCQFCGVALSRRTNYRKKCGAQLIDAKKVDEPESVEQRQEGLYGWLIQLSLWGLGLILGGMLLMKKAQLSTGLIVAYMILSSLVFLILFGLALSGMFSSDTGSNEMDGASQIGQLDTNELNPANDQTTIDSMPSVTETTTRRLEPATKTQDT
jgi:hypothetical protein